jgi:cobalt-precorrin-5B (C1)-methyltransferase
MEEYRNDSGKKLRKGYTTGSCAAGAAQAAVRMLAGQAAPDWVEVEAPNGRILTLPVGDCRMERGTARCSVVKDAGDDPDVTDGIKVFAQASFRDEAGVVIEAGEGIGRVTLPGLKIPVGRPAINPVPLQMIETEVKRVLPLGKGVRIVLSIPGGAELAGRTFNPKLGIVGGISILGTTGIVEPLSQEALRESLALKLSVMKAAGLSKALFVFGNYGEQFALQLGADCKYCAKIGNYLGFMLDKALEYGFREILLVGHLGKLIKVAAGIFQTHSRVADARAEIICAYAALAGAPQPVLEGIYACVTTEAATEVMERNGIEGVYPQIAAKVSKRCQEYVGRRIKIGAVLFNGADRLLAMDAVAGEILEGFKE